MQMSAILQTLVPNIISFTNAFLFKESEIADIFQCSLFCAQVETLTPTSQPF